VQENNFNLSKPPSSTLGGGSDFTTSNVLDSKRRVRACTGRIILKRIETLVESTLGGKPDFIVFYIFTGARSPDETFGDYPRVATPTLYDVTLTQ